jgi:hypothetical protein
MNAMTTIEGLREVSACESEGFAEVSRAELERTEGGMVIGADNLLSVIRLRAQPEPPGFGVFLF